jgi:hypothetical protein
MYCVPLWLDDGTDIIVNIVFDTLEWVFLTVVWSPLELVYNTLMWLFDSRVVQWATRGWSFEVWRERSFGVWFENCWAVRWLDEYLGDDN